jgi:DNA-3-methyladenine glycosylase
MQRFTPLARQFYEPSAKLVAPALLGHWLIRNTPDGPCGGPIVETEAYLDGDPASHGAPGPTARNQVMFGPPGRGYVYFIYGNYFCMNAVCRPNGVAEAVLIRAVEAAVGEDLMRKHRPVEMARDLTNGPGKLCLAMDIDRDLDGADLCNSKSPLYIARNPTVDQFRQERAPLVIGTRIGLTKAANVPLRFYLEGSSFISPWKIPEPARAPRRNARGARLAAAGAAARKQ